MTRRSCVALLALALMAGSAGAQEGRRHRGRPAPSARNSATDPQRGEERTLLYQLADAQRSLGEQIQQLKDRLETMHGELATGEDEDSALAGEIKAARDEIKGLYVESSSVKQQIDALKVLRPEPGERQRVADGRHAERDVRGAWRPPAHEQRDDARCRHRGDDPHTGTEEPAARPAAHHHAADPRPVRQRAVDGSHVRPEHEPACTDGHATDPQPPPRTTTQDTAPGPPTLCASPSSACFTCRAPASPRSCVTHS